MIAVVPPIHSAAFSAVMFHMETETKSPAIRVVLGNARYHVAKQFLQSHPTGQCIVRGVVRAPREEVTQEVASTASCRS